MEGCGPRVQEMSARPAELYSLAVKRFLDRVLFTEKQYLPASARSRRAIGLRERERKKELHREQLHPHHRRRVYSEIVAVGRSAGTTVFLHYQTSVQCSRKPLLWKSRVLLRE